MQEAILNSFGDLAVIGELKPIIGKKVEVVKKTKSGLYQIKYNGETYSVPKKNLDFQS